MKGRKRYDRTCGLYITSETGMGVTLSRNPITDSQLRIYYCCGADVSVGKRDRTMLSRCGQIWLEVSPLKLTKSSCLPDSRALSGFVSVRQSMSRMLRDFVR